MLAELHDHAPVHSWAESKASIEEAFGKPVEELFEEIDHKPLASGSVAQVRPANGKLTQRLPCDLQSCVHSTALFAWLPMMCCMYLASLVCSSSSQAALPRQGAQDPTLAGLHTRVRGYVRQASAGQRPAPLQRPSTDCSRRACQQQAAGLGHPPPSDACDQGPWLQVHLAKIRVAGAPREVVVKVRHPGVERRIAQDFRLLVPMAALTSRVTLQIPTQLQPAPGSLRQAADHLPSGCPAAVREQGTAASFGGTG